jgi:hypothetical protein
VLLTGTFINEPLPLFPLAARARALAHTIGILLVLGGFRLVEQIFTWLQRREAVLSLQQREWKRLCRGSLGSWSRHPRFLQEASRHSNGLLVAN